MSATIVNRRSLLSCKLAALAAGALLVVGCTSSGPSGSPDASSPDAQADAQADTRGDGGGEVLPKKMVRDKTTACPAAFASTAPSAGGNQGFEVAGQQRGFHLRLPDAGAHSGPRPLMVYFHGTNGSGDEVATFSFGDELLGRGFIVVGPDGADNGTVWPEWDAMREPNDRSRDNLDLQFVDKLIECLAAHFEVDENRLYISGMSAGGIMTNRVLRERSQLLAGGVVGSGIFELTEPATPGDLQPMAVLVAWGGDNDEWGGTNAGKTVPTFNFAQQAALASAHYENAPGVHQVHCRGDNLGHKWLAGVNALMADFLQAHPKGRADNPGWTLQAPPATAKVQCSEDAAVYTPKVQVTCALATKPDCQSYCQRIADCAVENDSVRPILAPQLTKLGFAGENHAECAGCVTACEQDLAQGGSADETVLTCFMTSSAAECSAGLQGALSLADTVNQCCKDQTTSAVCTRLCQAMLENSVAAQFFGSCTAFKP